MDDVQWKLATLPVRDGGLGIRQVSMLASSAYLASAASTKSLGSTILGMEDWNDEYKNQILSARGSTLPMGNAQALTKQSAWDRPLIDHDKAEVWSAYTDPCSRARLVAVSSPHSGDWLLTMQISSCGLCLENEAFGWRSVYASALSYAHHTSADVEKESTLKDTMGWSANCQVIVPADTMLSMT